MPGHMKATALGARSVFQSLFSRRSVSDQPGPTGECTPFQAAKIVRRHFVRTRFFDTADVPDEISGFEDLTFLFGTSQANYALCLLGLEEAAYLYRLVRSMASPRIAEIGRFKGGTTFLLAAAGGLVTSIDLPVSDGRDAVDTGAGSIDGERLDALLRSALQRAGLGDRVNLIQGDSRAQAPEPQSFDIVFIDGDHSYANAKADIGAWHDAVRVGGALLIHDVERADVMIKGVPELRRLLDEFLAEQQGRYEKVASAGSVAHLRRLG